MYKTLRLATNRPFLAFSGLKLIHTCCCDSAGLSRQEANFMMKIMTGSRNPKTKALRKHDQEVRRSLVEAVTKKSATLATSSSGKINQRRRAVLNAHFTRHIADHIATSDLQGFDIQITKVSVADDLSIVKAYWISRTNMTGHSDSLQTDLDKYAVNLRRDLSAIRTVGSMPPVKFVPDKMLAKASVLEQLLKTIEMSEELDDIPEESGTSDDAIPPMRQDVLGLDRGLIFTKIARNHKRLISSSRDENDNVNSEDVDLVDVQAKIAEFKAKMKVIKTSKLKLHKHDKKYRDYDENAQHLLTSEDYLESRSDEQEDIYIEDDFKNK